MPQYIKSLLPCSVMILLLASCLSMRPIKIKFNRVVQLKHVQRANVRIRAF